MKNEIDVSRICRLMDSDNAVNRAAAMEFSKGRNDIPASIILRGLRDDDEMVRAFALEVCEERPDIKAEIIEYTIDHEICGVRVREEIGRELYYMITKTEE